MNRTLRGYLFAWTALLALLALTVASSFLAMGRWNLVANLAIAGAKALLVAIVFMDLRGAATTTRLAAVAGLAWLALLAALGGADFVMR